MMQLEVILPLSPTCWSCLDCPFMPCVNATGAFLNEYFLGSRSMGGIVLA
jgi:sodium/pantothenate symporter